jgi:mono/diheme cytochrome c family protein
MRGVDPVRIWRIVALAAAGALIGIPLSAVSAQDTTTRDVTFSRDVAPIVFDHCVYCHRPGNVGPFSMATYADARPWARSIRQAVLTRRMPPWFADPGYSRLQHDRRLSDDDIRTIAVWVDGGSKEGDSRFSAVPRDTRPLF